MVEKDLNIDELNLNTLNLKFTNCSDFNPTILVDGKKINGKKDNFGNLNYTHKTNKNSVEIKITKYYDILGKFWFFTSLFFFIVSLFGILDVRPDKKCLTLDATLKVNIEKQSELKIIFKTRKNNEKALEFETTNCNLEEPTNCNYYVNETAKKKYKTMKVVKIVLWIALVASLIAVTLL